MALGGGGMLGRPSGGRQDLTSQIVLGEQSSQSAKCAGIRLRLVNVGRRRSLIVCGFLMLDDVAPKLTEFAMRFVEISLPKWRHCPQLGRYHTGICQRRPAWGSEPDFG